MLEQNTKLWSYASLHNRKYRAVNNETDEVEISNESAERLNGR
jgi:hypothetical protein